MLETQNRPATGVNGTATAESWETDMTEGWFEIAVKVTDVRGKNTKLGPTLQVVLETAVGEDVADLMALIGSYGTRVLFKPAAVQQRLPEADDDEETEDEPEDDA